ncbi:hypothetical protein DSM21852_31340 [Methylocystis bryophila]|nr:hypothetical protein DSM21852_31340 [Methylocystis bryophila]
MGTSAWAEPARSAEKEIVATTNRRFIFDPQQMPTNLSRVAEIHCWTNRDRHRGERLRKGGERFAAAAAGIEMR